MSLNFIENNSRYFICAEWDQTFEIVHSKAFKTSLLWSCILSGVLAVHAFVLNSLIVALYFKDRRLQTTSNVLILALALTDLFVALITQPAAIVNSVLELNEIYNCASQLVAFSLAEFGVGLSCCTVCFVITGERLLAICWPLKHRALVTKSILKRTFFVLMLLYALVLPAVLNASLETLVALESGYILLGAIFMFCVYLRIFVAIHNRAKTIGKTYATRNCVNVSQPSKSMHNHVSQDSKKNSNFSKNISQDPKRTFDSLKNLTFLNLTQDFRERDSLKIISQNSRHNDLPTILSHCTLCDMNSPNDDSVRKLNLSQNMSQLSICEFRRVSNVSQDSNGNSGELPKRKLKDSQCTLGACATVSKAMVNLRQELRVCKTMSIVSGAFAVCFIPRMVILFCTLTGMISWQAFYNYYAPWVDVLAYANSSLNPYIYFFHNKDLSEGVKSIIFGKNNSQPNKTCLPARLTTEEKREL